ncbi:hypothetical protein Tco_0787406, partial [Tanacetum coccineum]
LASTAICKNGGVTAINKVPIAFKSFFLASFYSTVVGGTNVSTPSTILVGRGESPFKITFQRA